MAAKTTASTYTPGVDADLDKAIEEAKRVMAAGGKTVDEKTLTEVMVKKWRQVKGEPEPVEEEETPEKPKVDLKAEAKKLDVSVVAKAAAGDSYWYEKPEDAKFMKHFFDLRTKASAVGNLLVVGPSGAGKTEGLRRIAEVMGKPFYKMDCATITTEDKWVGHKEIDASGTHFVVSEHLKWLQATEYEPGIVCYDEISRIHPSRLNILLPILDGSQALFVPDLGQYVPVHPETIIVATANIGSAFGGTFVLDRALRERFNFTLEREFPPAAEEVKVLTSATGIPEDPAKVIVDIANQTRVKWQTSDLESPISTRTLKAAALLIASGMSVQHALEYTALPLYKAEGGASSERHLVNTIIQGKQKAK